jgi:hypothetical protein
MARIVLDEHGVSRKNYLTGNPILQAGSPQPLHERFGQPTLSREDQDVFLPVKQKETYRAHSGQCFDLIETIVEDLVEIHRLIDRLTDGTKDRKISVKPRDLFL